MPFATFHREGNRVCVVFKGVPSDDADLGQYLSDLDKLYREKVRFLILYDATRIGWISNAHIRTQAEFMRTRADETRRYMVRAAIVVSGRAAALVMYTLFTMRKPVSPCMVFTDLDSAKQYLRQANLAKLEVQPKGSGPDDDGCLNDVVMVSEAAAAGTEVDADSPMLHQLFDSEVASSLAKK
jgi:hypothetical protein